MRASVVRFRLILKALAHLKQILPELDQVHLVRIRAVFLGTLSVLADDVSNRVSELVLNFLQELHTLMHIPVLHATKQNRSLQSGDIIRIRLEHHTRNSEAPSGYRRYKGGIECELHGADKVHRRPGSFRHFHLGRDDSDPNILRA